MKKCFIVMMAVILNIGFFSAQRLDYSNPFKNEIYFQDGKTKVTKDNLKKYFENVLIKQGNQASIVSFQLLDTSDESLKKKNLLLVGYNKYNSTKIGIALAFENGIYKLMESDGSVTCTGCTKGCNPRKELNEWICTDCDWDGGSSGCKKSVTVKF